MPDQKSVSIWRLNHLIRSNIESEVFHIVLVVKIINLSQGILVVILSDLLAFRLDKVGHTFDITLFELGQELGDSVQILIGRLLKLAVRLRKQNVSVLRVLLSEHLVHQSVHFCLFRVGCLGEELSN